MTPTSRWRLILAMGPLMAGGDGSPLPPFGRLANSQKSITRKEHKAG